jgi:hypothetical protein
MGQKWTIMTSENSEPQEHPQGAEPIDRVAAARRRIDTLSAKIAAVYASVPVDEGTAEIDEAIAEVRRPRLTI